MIILIIDFSIFLNKLVPIYIGTNLLTFNYIILVIMILLFLILVLIYISPLLKGD